jgi:hypothetical protein
MTIGAIKELSQLTVSAGRIDLEVIAELHPCGRHFYAFWRSLNSRALGQLDPGSYNYSTVRYSVNASVNDE